VSVRGILLPILTVAASCAAWLLRPAGMICAPWLRFWRLAMLRSMVDGVVPLSTQFDGPVRTAGRVRLQMGEHCRLGRDVFFETPGDGVIRIGDHTRINSGVFIVARQEVRIGNNCLVGEYVSIRDANHGIAPNRLIRTQPHNAAAIQVGNDVWICRGAVILKGSQIGDGAVVGANGVVTKGCESNEIVAGVPARRIHCRRDDDASDRPPRHLT
jgi:acetyltransferase-like isoleucine patch superfamily enzyme